MPSRRRSQAHPVRAFAAVTELLCTECGARSILRTPYPACPACGGTTLEPAPWRPFSRLAAARTHRNGARAAVRGL